MLGTLAGVPVQADEGTLETAAGPFIGNMTDSLEQDAQLLEETPETRADLLCMTTGFSDFSDCSSLLERVIVYAEEPDACVDGESSLPAICGASLDDVEALLHATVLAPYHVQGLQATCSRGELTPEVTLDAYERLNSTTGELPFFDAEATCEEFTEALNEYVGGETNLFMSEARLPYCSEWDTVAENVDSAPPGPCAWVATLIEQLVATMDLLGLKHRGLTYSPDLTIDDLHPQHRDYLLYGDEHLGEGLYTGQAFELPDTSIMDAINGGFAHQPNTTTPTSPLRPVRDNPDESHPDDPPHNPGSPVPPTPGMPDPDPGEFDVPCTDIDNHIRYKQTQVGPSASGAQTRASNTAASTTTYYQNHGTVQGAEALAEAAAAGIMDAAGNPTSSAGILQQTANDMANGITLYIAHLGENVSEDANATLDLAAELLGELNTTLSWLVDRVAATNATELADMIGNGTATGAYYTELKSELYTVLARHGVHQSTAAPVAPYASNDYYPSESCIKLPPLDLNPYIRDTQPSSRPAPRPVPFEPRTTPFPGLFPPIESRALEADRAPLQFEGIPLELPPNPLPAILAPPEVPLSLQGLEPVTLTPEPVAGVDGTLVRPSGSHPQLTYSLVNLAGLTQFWPLIQDANEQAVSQSSGLVNPLAVADAPQYNIVSQRDGTLRITPGYLGVPTCIVLDNSTATRDLVGCDYYATLTWEPPTGAPTSAAVVNEPRIEMHSGVPGQAYDVEMMLFAQLPNVDRIYAFGIETVPASGFRVPDALVATAQGFASTTMPRQSGIDVATEPSGPAGAVRVQAASFRVDVDEPGKPVVEGYGSYMESLLLDVPPQVSLLNQFESAPTGLRTGGMTAVASGPMSINSTIVHERGDQKAVLVANGTMLPAGINSFTSHSVYTSSLQSEWVSDGATAEVEVSGHFYGGAETEHVFAFRGQNVSAWKTSGLADPSEAKFTSTQPPTEFEMVQAVQDSPCLVPSTHGSSLRAEFTPTGACIAGSLSGMTRLEGWDNGAAAGASSAHGGGVEAVHVFLRASNDMDVSAHGVPPRWDVAAVTDGQRQALSWTASKTGGSLDFTRFSTLFGVLEAELTDPGLHAEWDADPRLGTQAFVGSQPTDARIRSGTGPSALQWPLDDAALTVADESGDIRFLMALTAVESFQTTLTPTTLSMGGTFAAPLPEASVAILGRHGDLETIGDLLHNGGTWNVLFTTQQEGRGLRHTASSTHGMEYTAWGAFEADKFLVSTKGVQDEVAFAVDLNSQSLNASATPWVDNLDVFYAPGGAYPNIEAAQDYIVMSDGLGEITAGLSMRTREMQSISPAINQGQVVVDSGFRIPTPLRVRSHQGEDFLDINATPAPGRMMLSTMPGSLQLQLSEPGATVLAAASQSKKTHFVDLDVQGAPTSVSSTWTAYSPAGIAATLTHNGVGPVERIHFQSVQRDQEGEPIAAFHLKGVDVQPTTQANAVPLHATMQARSIDSDGNLAASGRLEAAFVERGETLLFPAATGAVPDAFLFHRSVDRTQGTIAVNGLKDALVRFRDSDRAPGDGASIVVTREGTQGIALDAIDEVTGQHAALVADSAPDEYRLDFAQGRAATDGFAVLGVSSGPIAGMTASLDNPGRFLAFLAYDAAPPVFQATWSLEAPLIVSGSDSFTFGLQASNEASTAIWGPETADFAYLVPGSGGNFRDPRLAIHATGVQKLTFDPVRRDIQSVGNTQKNPFFLLYEHQEGVVHGEGSDLTTPFHLTWNEFDRSYAVETGEPLDAMEFVALPASGSASALFAELQSAPAGVIDFRHDSLGHRFDFLSSGGPVAATSISIMPGGVDGIQTLNETGLFLSNSEHPSLMFNFLGVKEIAAVHPRNESVQFLFDNDGAGHNKQHRVQMMMESYFANALIDEVGTDALFMEWPAPSTGAMQFTVASTDSHTLNMSFDGGERFGQTRMEDGIGHWSLKQGGDGSLSFKGQPYNNNLIPLQSTWTPYTPFTPCTVSLTPPGERLQFYGVTPMHVSGPDPGKPIRTFLDAVGPGNDWAYVPDYRQVTHPDGYTTVVPVSGSLTSYDGSATRVLEATTDFGTEAPTAGLAVLEPGLDGLLADMNTGYVTLRFRSPCNLFWNADPLMTVHSPNEKWEFRLQQASPSLTPAIVQPVYADGYTAAYFDGGLSGLTEINMDTHDDGWQVDIQSHDTEMKFYHMRTLDQRLALEVQPESNGASVQSFRFDKTSTKPFAYEADGRASKVAAVTLWGERVAQIEAFNAPERLQINADLSAGFKGNLTTAGSGEALLIDACYVVERKDYHTLCILPGAVDRLIAVTELSIDGFELAPGLSIHGDAFSHAGWSLEPDGSTNPFTLQVEQGLDSEMYTILSGPRDWLGGTSAGTLDLEVDFDEDVWQGNGTSTGADFSVLIGEQNGPHRKTDYYYEDLSSAAVLHLEASRMIDKHQMEIRLDDPSRLHLTPIGTNASADKFHVHTDKPSRLLEATIYDLPKTFLMDVVADSCDVTSKYQASLQAGPSEITGPVRIQLTGGNRSSLESEHWVVSSCNTSHDIGVDLPFIDDTHWGVNPPHATCNASYRFDIGIDFMFDLETSDSELWGEVQQNETGLSPWITWEAHGGRTEFEANATLKEFTYHSKGLPHCMDLGGDDVEVFDVWAKEMAKDLFVGVTSVGGTNGGEIFIHSPSGSATESFVGQAFTNGTGQAGPGDTITTAIEAPFGYFDFYVDSGPTRTLPQGAGLPGDGGAQGLVLYEQGTTSYRAHFEGLIRFVGTLTDPCDGSMAFAGDLRRASGWGDTTFGIYSVKESDGCGASRVVLDKVPLAATVDARLPASGGGLGFSLSELEGGGLGTATLWARAGCGTTCVNGQVFDGHHLQLKGISPLGAEANVVMPERSGSLWFGPPDASSFDTVHLDGIRYNSMKGNDGVELAMNGSNVRAEWINHVMLAGTQEHGTYFLDAPGLFSQGYLRAQQDQYGIEFGKPEEWGSAKDLHAILTTTEKLEEDWGDPTTQQITFEYEYSGSKCGDVPFTWTRPEIGGAKKGSFENLQCEPPPLPAENQIPGPVLVVDQPDGPHRSGETVNLRVSAIDPEESAVRYFFDWNNDGEADYETGWFPSGATVTVRHLFPQATCWTVWAMDFEDNEGEPIDCNIAVPNEAPQGFVSVVPTAHGSLKVEASLSDLGDRESDPFSVSIYWGDGSPVETWSDKSQNRTHVYPARALQDGGFKDGYNGTLYLEDSVGPVGIPFNVQVGLTDYDLAAYFGPVIYQDTDPGENRWDAPAYRFDQPVPLPECCEDFPTTQWGEARFKDAPATIHYEVTETAGHYYLMYAMYYPRKWSLTRENNHFAEDPKDRLEMENQITSVLVRVAKDGTGNAIGIIEEMLTTPGHYLGSMDHHDLTPLEVGGSLGGLWDGNQSTLFLPSLWNDPRRFNEEMHNRFERAEQPMNASAYTTNADFPDVGGVHPVVESMAGSHYLGRMGSGKAIMRYADKDGGRDFKDHDGLILIPPPTVPAPSNDSIPLLNGANSPEGAGQGQGVGLVRYQLREIGDYWLLQQKRHAEDGSDVDEYTYDRWFRNDGGAIADSRFQGDEGYCVQFSSEPTPLNEGCDYGYSGSYRPDEMTRYEKCGAYGYNPLGNDAFYETMENFDTVMLTMIGTPSDVVELIDIIHEDPARSKDKLGPSDAVAVVELAIAAYVEYGRNVHTYTTCATSEPHDGYPNGKWWHNARFDLGDRLWSSTEKKFHHDDDQGAYAPWGFAYQRSPEEGRQLTVDQYGWWYDRPAALFNLIGDNPSSSQDDRIIWRSSGVLVNSFHDYVHYQKLRANDIVPKYYYETDALDMTIWQPGEEDWTLMVRKVELCGKKDYLWVTFDEGGEEPTIMNNFGHQYGRARAEDENVPNWIRSDEVRILMHLDADDKKERGFSCYGAWVELPRKEWGEGLWSR